MHPHLRLRQLSFLLVAGALTGVVEAQQDPAGGPGEVSYTNDIRPIVNNFCTTCHSGTNPEGDFVLTSYAEVRRYTEKGKLLARINDADDPMPQNGLMPQYMRRLFRQWTQQGYINEGQSDRVRERKQMLDFKPPRIVPVDVSKQGFEMLELMQGHWVGSMTLMGVDYDWMAFDYRAIAPSHVHGIFEGGSMGNLFTSFFVADFSGTRTIVARNGGLLNGIYRTSYFVLDKVRQTPGEKFFRFVDAHGGRDIMSMELTFRGNRLEFNSWTSRFGLTEARTHMSFKGRRMHRNLAQAAAREVGFPKNVIDYRFPAKLPKPTWASEYPHTSASYMSEVPGQTLIELGRLARDPRRVDQMPHLARLSVQIRRSQATRQKKLHVYLSRDSLVTPEGRFITQAGYIRGDLLNTLLSFPELGRDESEFTFTYLHPGDYYVTVVADMDEDGYPSPGDITHRRTHVTVRPRSNTKVVIPELTARN